MRLLSRNRAVGASFAISLACNGAAGFQNSAFKMPKRENQLKGRIRNRPSTGQLNAFEGAVAAIDSFYHTQPFLSAFVTASFKASMADLLAQTSAAAPDAATTSSPSAVDMDSVVLKAHAFSAGHQTSTPAATPNEMFALPDDMDVDMNRNLAFILYGGLYQGMFLQFTYSMLYPYLFGDMPYRVVLQVISDVLIFGPLVTLPLAYVIKALLQEVANDNEGSNDCSNKAGFGVLQAETSHATSIDLIQTVQHGLSKYKNHVETQNLLLQYWAFWAPAQIINQGFVPDHLRVAFVACVGFFWIILLSAISSRNETTDSSSTATASK